MGEDAVAIVAGVTWLSGALAVLDSVPRCVEFRNARRRKRRSVSKLTKERARTWDIRPSLLACSRIRKMELKTRTDGSQTPNGTSLDSAGEARLEETTSVVPSF